MEEWYMVSNTLDILLRLPFHFPSLLFTYLHFHPLSLHFFPSYTFIISVFASFLPFLPLHSLIPSLQFSSLHPFSFPLVLFPPFLPPSSFLPVLLPPSLLLPSSSLPSFFPSFFTSLWHLSPSHILFHLFSSPPVLLFDLPPIPHFLRVPFQSFFPPPFLSSSSYSPLAFPPLPSPPFTLLPLFRPSLY